MRWAYNNPKSIRDIKPRIILRRCGICLDLILNEQMRMVTRYSEHSNRPFRLYICMACALSHNAVKTAVLDCSLNDYLTLVEQVNSCKLVTSNLVFNVITSILVLGIVMCVLTPLIRQLIQAYS